MKENGGGEYHGKSKMSFRSLKLFQKYSLRLFILYIYSYIIYIIFNYLFI